MSWLAAVIAVMLPWAHLCGCGGGSTGKDCGDGVIDGDEQCDGTALAGETCLSQGFYAGALSCDPITCRFDLTECAGACGNAVIEDGEQCEGTALGGETCQTLGYVGGSLACDPQDCMFDTAACTGGNCGNGIQEAQEACDGNDFGGDSCADHGYFNGDLSCSKTCQIEMDGCNEAPTIPVGDPCTADADCTGGMCFHEVPPWQNDVYGPALFGYPGGYCLEVCDLEGRCRESAAIAVCVTFSNGFTPCLRQCLPDGPANQCRAGYGCFDLGDGRGVCYPACDDDSQCGITGDCETDPAAEAVGFCGRPPEDCANGQDDDFDGRVDCSDLECSGQDACPPGENCTNGVDDDGDGAVDCADVDCVFSALCAGEVCAPPPGAVLTCGAAVTGSNDAPGSTDVVETPCGQPGNTGPEYAYRFNVSSPQLVVVSLDNFEGDLDLYVVTDSQDATCDAIRGCLALSARGPYFAEELEFSAFPGTVYYVFVAGYNDAISAYDLAVACSSSGYEDCSNGQDDDGDGLSDCADWDCFGQAGCTTEQLCGNGQDDDWDGATDCDDSDCAADPACLPGAGYWELWERSGAAEMDLAGTTVTFTADASDPHGYTYQVVSGVILYPVAPGTGDVSTQVLSIPDDTTAWVALPAPFPFHGVDYPAMYIGDDGYVTFAEEAGHHPGPQGWNLYHHPRIAPLWGDLDPSAGGSIIFDAFTDRVAVTWAGLSNKGSGLLPNRFQLVLWHNGDIQMTWLAVDAVANLPTSTAGYVTIVGAHTGLPPPESDLLP